MNATPADLSQQVYDAEIAAGTSPRLALVMANAASHSPEYRAAWRAGREERLREYEEQEEELLVERSYAGNPRLEEL